MIKIGKNKLWFGGARFQFYFLLGETAPQAPLSYGYVFISFLSGVFTSLSYSSTTDLPALIYYCRILADPLLNFIPTVEGTSGMSTEMWAESKAINKR